MTVIPTCPATYGSEQGRHAYILVKKPKGDRSTYRICSKCGIREMVDGDIVDAAYLLDLLLNGLARMLGMSYGQLVPGSAQFHTGGVITPREPKPLPEGVVGYSFSGQPIYDGEWFDRKIAGLGPSITVRAP